MKRLLTYFKATLIGGLFFIVPIVVVLLIFGKVVEILRALVAPIVEKLPMEAIGGIPVARIVAFFVLIFICLIAGLFAKTKIANRIKDWAEDNILVNVPGYTLLKGMSESAVGLETRYHNDVVLVDVEEVWQIGFLMDKIDEDLSTVFLPGAPSPMSGDVVFVQKDRIKKLDITAVEAVKILKKLGMDSSTILKDKMDSEFFKNT